MLAGFCSLFLIVLPAHTQFPSGVSTGKESQGESIKGFRVPDYNDDGTLKSILYGETAVKNNRTQVWDMTGVRIEVFNSNQVSAVVSSPGCEFDMRRDVTQSDQPIVILHEKAQIQGTGYVWNRKKETFQIHSKARVMIRREATGLTDMAPGNTEEGNP